MKSFSTGAARLPRTARCDIGMLHSFHPAWTLFSRCGSRPPSPRVRGEGRGEGAFPLGSDSRQRPPPPIVSLRPTLPPPPPPRGGGEESKTLFLGAWARGVLHAQSKKALPHY